VLQKRALQEWPRRLRATIRAFAFEAFEAVRRLLHRARAIPADRETASYIVSMEDTRPLDTVPDDELLRRLSELLRRSRRVEADLVAHVGEADARRLYAREASPSMFAYCTEVLHLSSSRRTCASPLPVPRGCIPCSSRCCATEACT
jgi:hypothetical protein